MDNWLKGLIATACVVIIAGGAYFAWGVYGVKQERDAANYRALLKRICYERSENVKKHRARNLTLPADERQRYENCIKDFPEFTT